MVYPYVVHHQRVFFAKNHAGNYNEPKTLQNSDKLAKDAHRSMLKRKRNTAEVDGSNSKSKSNENHYYNSQLLTKKAPISTKKYKARRRVLSSAESSSFEDDMIPPASPVRINDFKPLIKLNTDRPDRLILPTASKTEGKTLKAVPTDPSILGKPRPKVWVLIPLRDTELKCPSRNLKEER